MIRTSLTVFVLAGLLLSACSETSEHAVPETTPCASPSPAANRSDVPAELRLDELTTITLVQHRGGQLRVTASTDLPVVEIYPPLARAVIDAGYSIVNSDNEGFEAEIFFGDKRDVGAYLMREGPCRGEVTVRLLFEERGRTKSS